MKRMMKLLLCATLTMGLVGCGDNTKELIKTKLKELGAKNITEIVLSDDTPQGTNDIKYYDVKSDKKKLVCGLIKKDDLWEVSYIINSDNDKLYYDNDIDEYIGRTIYNYSNDEVKEVIESKFPENNLTEEERKQAEQDNLQSEQEKLEASKTILDEIGQSFESNSISASEKYQDKAHFITATVDSVDTTMTGKPRVEVYQNNYKVQCVFNDGMMDKVKNLNKGDVITFYGTLDGWGVSADFTHCYFK